MNMTNIFAHTT